MGMAAVMETDGETEEQNSKVWENGKVRRRSICSIGNCFKWQAEYRSPIYTLLFCKTDIIISLK